jgi:hypothetical protein
VSAVAGRASEAEPHQHGEGHAHVRHRVGVVGGERDPVRQLDRQHVVGPALDIEMQALLETEQVHRIAARPGLVRWQRVAGQCVAGIGSGDQC